VSLLDTVRQEVKIMANNLVSNQILTDITLQERGHTKQPILTTEIQEDIEYFVHSFTNYNNINLK